MTAAQLRHHIENQIDQGDQHQSLQQYFDQKGPLLHHSIRLSGADQSTKLHRITLVYLRHVPDLLQDVRRAAGLSGIDALVEPALTMAESFFWKPPEVSQLPEGILGSVASAYLVHRLIEEINDIFHMCLGVSLWNHDITHANLLVYEMLGARVSNGLDAVVSQCVHQLTRGPEGLFVQPEFQRLQHQHQRNATYKVA